MFSSTLRHIALVVGLLATLVPAYAQQGAPPSAPTIPTAPAATDLLIKRNGDEVAVRIEEITPDLVKYRRADNLQGPLISILKSDVFMVRYANGTKDVFTAPRVTAAIPTPDTTFPPLAKTEPTDSVFADVDANGPRIGLTVVGNGKLRNRLRDDFNASNVVTQFGWQFENRLFRLPSGLSGLFELVPLIGGLEQGLFLPSVSGILGLRTKGGFEVGFGPNVSLAGAGFAIATGVTLQGKYVNVPLNFAMVPGRGGNRFSFLVGFTYRRRHR
jgi:hypothetical protein